MVDLATLATGVVAFLAPFLPYLQQAGEKVAEEVGEKFGEGLWDKAKALWGKLSPEIAAKDHAQGAVEVLAKRPDDPRAKGAVELQIEEILAAKPGLASEVAQLLQAAGPRASWAHLVGDGAIAQGKGAVAAGKGGVAAGRDVVIGAPWPGMPGGPRERE
ncbi:MAG TPA: hypothetical protein VGS07_31505 [Thermoanaerobaculia bacterium]|jgi:hypothetical protein|nr:hypothetical protein [Thermoanaerobaculia bacterium]